MLGWILIKNNFFTKKHINTNILKKFKTFVGKEQLKYNPFYLVALKKKQQQQKNYIPTVEGGKNRNGRNGLEPVSRR